MSQDHQALVERAEHYQMLVENLKDVVLTVSPHGELTYCSPVVTEFGGYDVEPELGHHIGKYIADEADLARIERYFQQPNVAPRTRSTEFLFKPANNTAPFAVELSIKPIVREDRLVSYHCVMRDIADRKRAEEERATLERQLLNAQKMKAIGMLTGGIAHDMNNMLGVVMSAASLIESNLGSDDPNMVDVKDILTSCRRSRELAHVLLRFAHPRAPARIRIRMNDVIGDVLKLLQYSVRKKIEIVTELNEALSEIEGDDHQCQQALLHVCLNAIESMGDAGRLTIATKNRMLDSEQSVGRYRLAPGRYVQVEVTDTGQGMEESVIREIFDPLYSAHRERASVHPAGPAEPVSGGNSPCVVDVSSDPEHGTTVTLWFSAWRSERGGGTRPQHNPVEAPNGAPPLGILFVDDEELVLSTGCRLLKNMGYRVFTASNGQRAIELYRQNKDDISLVVLDLIMPVMDGAATFEALKRIDSTVKVLISSGYDKDEKVQALLQGGVVGFLHKPFDSQRLVETVANALNG